MLAVKYVVKLYEMPAAYGVITAFDTYSNMVFIGTDKGVLHKFIVEGTLGSSPTATRTAATSSSSSSSTNAQASRAFAASEFQNVDGLSPPLHSTNPTDESASKQDPNSMSNRTSGGARFEELGNADPENEMDTSNIFTTHVKSEVVSQHKKKVVRLQHSRSHALLFVLCDRRLTVLDSYTLTPIQTIVDDIGTFFVSNALNAGSDSKRSGLHIVCTAEKSGKRLSVFELDASLGKNARAVLAQELVLPEPVQTMVTYGGIVCVGLKREYSLLSLADGTARGILSLGGSKSPLLAPGDGEVYMRYSQSIFTVSMRSIPTTGRALGRTIQLEDEAACMVVRHPFLFAFTEHHCDVFSLYDDEVVERLPIPGCVFGSQLGRGDYVYAAGKSRIWMICIHPLRHQLADLVERFKIEEAFHLLGSQRAKTTLDLQGIELELHIMAGFAYLYHCRPKEALQHFNDHVDPREILLHIPELVPTDSAYYSRRLRHLLSAQAKRAAKAKKRREQEKSVLSYDAANAENGQEKRGRTSSRKLEFAKEPDPQPENSPSSNDFVTQSFVEDEDEEGTNENDEHAVDHVAEENRHEESSESYPVPEPESPTSVPVGYWGGWEGCSPHNSHHDDIERAWMAVFRTFPLVASSAARNQANARVRKNPRTSPATSSYRLQSSTTSTASGASPASVQIRQVNDLGCVDAEAFLAHCWATLKDELLMYLRSRLSFCNEVHARAIEYALLVLYLQSRDYRGAFRMIRFGRALCVEDCYDLLYHALEFRLLALLLQRRGFLIESDALLRNRVHISSYVKCRAKEVTALGHLWQRSPAEWLQKSASSSTAALHTVGRSDDDIAHIHKKITECSWAKNMTVTHSCMIARLLLADTLLPLPITDTDASQYDELGLSKLKVLELPGNTFSEVFFAVDQLNLAMLREILAETPEAVLLCDDEGATLLHVAVSLLGVGGASCATTGSASAGAHSRGETQVGGSVPQGSAGEDDTKEHVVLQLVLACALMLLDFGCPLSWRDNSNRTWIDVLRNVASDATFDLVIATMLAASDVRCTGAEVSSHARQGADMEQ